jgi:hypothetical protein
MTPACRKPHAGQCDAPEGYFWNPRSIYAVSPMSAIYSGMRVMTVRSEVVYTPVCSSDS